MKYAFPSTLISGLNVPEVNLGDCIQYIATQRLLRKYFNYNDEFVYLQRDHGEMQSCRGMKDLHVMACGWYFQDLNWAFTNPDNDYTITGFYIERGRWSKPEVLNKKFKSHDVNIGCRDYHTYNYLQKNGFKNSYFSGCMTLTLDKRTEVKNDNVYIVDVSDETIDAIQMRFGMRKVFKYINSIPIKKLTWMDFMRMAEERYNEIKYNASLVVTSRIHVYMPCIAMGVPVIYTGPITPRTEIVRHITEKSIEKIKPIVAELFVNAVNDVRDISLERELFNATYKG